MSQKRLETINRILLDPDQSEERASIVLSAAHHACGIDLFAYETLEDMPEKEAEKLFGFIGEAIQAIAFTEEETGKKYAEDELLGAAIEAMEELGEYEIPDAFYEETGME